jgi:hypothetical protein
MEYLKIAQVNSRIIRLNGMVDQGDRINQISVSPEVD